MTEAAPERPARTPPSCATPARRSGCSSRRTRSSAAQPPTCPRQTCREKALPARERARRRRHPRRGVPAGLKLSRQPYYRWRHQQVTKAEVVEAYRSNALLDAHLDDPEYGYRLLVDEAADAGE